MLNKLLLAELNLRMDAVHDRMVILATQLRLGLLYATHIELSRQTYRATILLLAVTVREGEGCGSTSMLD